MTIDAHQHFWQYHPQRHSWINDQMAVLKQDFLPADLEKIYQENAVHGCIAVQADQSEDETDFLLGLATKYSIIKGVVGWVDFRADNIEERLAYYAKFPLVRGFRHIVQDEPDANFMLKEDFQRGLGYLDRYGFTYDILIFPTQMEAALKTIQKFPNQRFVIDHIAKPYIKDGNTPGWEQHMRAFAEYPNVYCKVSGMVTEADWQNWSYEDFVPWLDIVFEAFGTDRMMYGSDWPVCLLAGTYPQVKGILERYLTPYSTEEKQKIWGGNAIRFYDIEKRFYEE